jgi:hypothetical protein
MGFRYQKRVNISDGLGINVSRSGLSPSYRTRYGSIGPKGFSLRTGIPGLTFKRSFSRMGGKNTFPVTLAILLLAGLLFAAAIVIYNVVLFLSWVIRELYHAVLRRYYLHRIAREEHRVPNPEKE